MVSAKKVARKVSRDEKPIVESVKQPEVKFVAEPTEPIKLVKEDTPITVDYKLLLAEAPEIPYITKVEDAVEFVDKYAKWKRKVKQST